MPASIICMKPYKIDKSLYFFSGLPEYAYLSNHHPHTKPQAKG